MEELLWKQVQRMNLTEVLNMTFIFTRLPGVEPDCVNDKSDLIMT